MTVNGDPTTPDTIVLIHGFWVTPRSWEDWKAHYQAKGYRVLTPAYPGFEVEVEALNADPTPIENLTVPAVIDHLTEVIGGLERPPILMGHSAGGVFTQLMLDRGYGAVGVVMDSAPTEGVPVVPLSQLKSTFPVLRTVGRKKAAGFTFEQWHYAFCNTFPEERSRQLYERYHIPGSVRVLWGSALATLEPGPPGHLRQLRQRPAGAAAVHLRHPRPPHAALGAALQRQALQVQDGHRGGGVRGPAPAALQRRLGRGRRLRPGLGRPARGPQPAMTEVTLTHIGGPTVLLEVEGWRLLTDPTFDAPGRRYTFGWGSGPCPRRGRPLSHL